MRFIVHLHSKSPRDKHYDWRFERENGEVYCFASRYIPEEEKKVLFIPSGICGSIESYLVGETYNGQLEILATGEYVESHRSTDQMLMFALEAKGKIHGVLTLIVFKKANGYLALFHGEINLLKRSVRMNDVKIDGLNSEDIVILFSHTQEEDTQRVLMLHYNGKDVVCGSYQREQQGKWLAKPLTGRDIIAIGEYYQKHTGEEVEKQLAVTGESIRAERAAVKAAIKTKAREEQATLQRLAEEARIKEVNEKGGVGHVVDMFKGGGKRKKHASAQSILIRRQRGEVDDESDLHNPEIIKALGEEGILLR